MQTKYKIKNIDSKTLLTNEKASLFWESTNYKSRINKKTSLNHLFSDFETPFFLYPKLNYNNVHLFGFPYNYGSNQTNSKVQNFPKTLRQASLNLPIYMEENNQSTSGIYDYIRNTHLLKNCMLLDHGDLLLKSKNLGEIKTTIYDILKDICINEASKFLVVGGDHSITHILVKNLIQLTQKKIIIYQFDAHHDCGSDILKLDNEIAHDNFVRFLLQEEMIAGIIQIGVRGLRALGQRYSHPKLYQIHPNEIDKLHSCISDILSKNDNVVGYISFDTDVLDPRDFPLVDFPKVEGPTLQDIINMLCTIFKHSPPILGSDIVEGQSDGDLAQYDPILHIILYLLEGLTQTKGGL